MVADAGLGVVLLQGALARALPLPEGVRRILLDGAGFGAAVSGIARAVTRAGAR